MDVGYVSEDGLCTGGNLVCCVPGVDPNCPDDPLVAKGANGVCCNGACS